MLDRLIKRQFEKIQPYLTGRAGVADKNGEIIASNVDNLVELDADVIRELKLRDDYMVVEKIGYDWVRVDNSKVCCIFYEGRDEFEEDRNREIIELIRISITSALENGSRITDRDSFYKDLLAGDIDKAKISSLCYDLNISVSKSAYILILEYISGKRDDSIEEMLTTFFPNENKDYIIHIDEAHTAVISDFEEFDDEDKDIEVLIRGLADEIRLEVSQPVYIGIGTRATDIYGFRRAYENAVEALNVGKIFYSEDYVFNYSKIGIAKLIYTLPVEVCKKFIQDVLPGEALNFFSDKEIINTVKTFLTSNLNMSVAARELYVHRNTLVYRLDKIRKLTGYDLATFDDAVNIKIALMIKDYLDRNKSDMEDTNDKI